MDKVILIIIRVHTTPQTRDWDRKYKTSTGVGDGPTAVQPNHELEAYKHKRVTARLFPYMGFL